MRQVECFLSGPCHMNINLKRTPTVFLISDYPVELHMRERTINLILSLMTVLLVSNGPAHGFDYFEHRHLGNQAYREATMGSIVNAPSGFYNDLHQAEKKLGVSIGQNESGSNNHDLIDQIPIEFGDL